MPRISEIFETLEYGPAPESADRAQAWLRERARSFGLFIGGDWVEGTGAEAFDTVNPANGTALARITQGGPGDVDQAVRAARAAQEPWAQLGGHARARFLYALARRIHRHARLFSVLETLDNGKPVRESRDIDIPLVVRHFHHHAGWAQLMDAEFPGQVPVGVAGQIIPLELPAADAGVEDRAPRWPPGTRWCSSPPSSRPSPPCSSPRSAGRPACPPES